MKENVEQDKLERLELPSLEELLKRDPAFVIPELYHMVKVLVSRVEKLEKENEELRSGIKQLKSRLNTDSHNSSKPPSSDGVKKSSSLCYAKARTSC